jgi:predicted transcriptional regulator
MTEETYAPNLLELATELTTAWLANPNTRVSADEVPAFLEKMHATVAGLTSSASQQVEAAAAPEYTPAVSVRRSLASKDHLISLIDGKPYKTLKRHLATQGLTPAQYRERYNLKSDYPMVAENYAEMRRGLAKKIGLGRKPGEKPVTKNAGNTVNAQQATSADNASAKPAAKPTGKAVTEPAAKATAKPGAKVASKSAGQAVAKSPKPKAAKPTSNAGSAEAPAQAAPKRRTARPAKAAPESNTEKVAKPKAARRAKSSADQAPTNTQGGDPAPQS